MQRESLSVPRRRTRRRTCRSSLSHPSQYYICTTIQRKPLSVPRRHTRNASASRAAVRRAAVRSRAPPALSHSTTFVLYKATKIPQRPAPPYAPSHVRAARPSGSVLCRSTLSTFVLQCNGNPSASPAAARAFARAAVRSRAPRPALSALYYICTTMKRIPQRPAPPYAPSHVPQSALAPLRLCQYYICTTIQRKTAPPYAPSHVPQFALAPLLCLPFVLQYNENPSAAPCAVVRAVARAAVRSRAPLALSPSNLYYTIQRKSLISVPRRCTRRRTCRSSLSRPSGSVSQHYICTTIQRKSLSVPRRRTRRRTCRSPLSRPSTTFVPQFNENPSAVRAVVLAVVRAAVALAPLRLCPPGATFVLYNATKIPSHVPQSALAPLRLCPPNTAFVLQFNENSSASRAAVRAVARAAVRSRAPPALSSQYIYYMSTTIQRKSLSAPRPRTRRRTCRNSLSRPSGSVSQYYTCTTTKIPERPAPPYAPSHVPQFALAPLRLCPPSTTFVLQYNENPSASRAAVRAVARAAVRSRAPPALSSQYYNLYYNTTKIPQRPAPPYAPSHVPQFALASLPVLHSYCNSTKTPQCPAPPHAPSHVPQFALAPLRLCPPSTTFVLQCNEIPQRPAPPYAPSHVPQFALAPLPVLHLCYNSTKIPQCPAPPYAPSHVPQFALAPLRLCPPSTTFVLQCNENPSASCTAVRAVARAAVCSRAPPDLSSQYYICTTI